MSDNTMIFHDAIFTEVRAVILTVSYSSQFPVWLPTKCCLLMQSSEIQLRSEALPDLIYRAEIILNHFGIQNISQSIDN
jgi:hypothetical protein